MAGINYGVLPSKDCRRLRHHTVDRLKQPGPGKVEVCAVCSTAYEMALATFDGDEQQADQFVQDIRRDKTAGPLRAN